MLYIVGNTIKLTRGDTAYLTVSITHNEEDYVVQSTDKLEFSVKKTVNDTEYVLRKEVIGNNVIHIEPSDTAGFAFGLYKYDIQLTTASGDVFTIVDVATFEIMPEVTE
jgi:hypothetical protein